MKIRTARKVLRKWQRGDGNYTDNHFGAVIRALRKHVSYETRHERDTLLEAYLKHMGWKKEHG